MVSHWMRLYSANINFTLSNFAFKEINVKYFEWFLISGRFSCINGRKSCISGNGLPLKIAIKKDWNDKKGLILSATNIKTEI